MVSFLRESLKSSFPFLVPYFKHQQVLVDLHATSVGWLVGCLAGWLVGWGGWVARRDETPLAGPAAGEAAALRAGSACGPLRRGAPAPLRRWALGLGFGAGLRFYVLVDLKRFEATLCHWGKG